MPLRRLSRFADSFPSKGKLTPVHRCGIVGGSAVGGSLQRAFKNIVSILKIVIFASAG